MRVIVIIATVLCASTAAVAAPKADLWKRWQAHDDKANATIDHSTLNAFLDQYVVIHQHAPNGVRYGDVSSADRRKLSAYLDTMQAIGIDRYNRDVQLAYWINLYNAATLKRVIDAYPVDSIRAIGGGLFSSGPWKQKFLSIEGEKLSLNDIEHRILRPIWNEPLIHYGVNCASMSCPDLRPEAYTAANVYSHLRANARDYVNSTAGATITDDGLTVSRICDWYAADFGGTPQAIISALRRFAEPALSARLDTYHRIDGYRYDWSLNDEAAMDDSPHTND